MGEINIDNTGSGAAVTLSSDGSSLLLGGSAIGGGGGGADLYAANESSPSAQPSATGANSIAIGDSSVSSGVKSVAIGGVGAQATHDYAVAIGLYPEAKGNYALSLQQGVATGTSSTSVGKGRASATNSVTINIDSTSTSYGAATTNGIAIGKNAKCSAGNLALGPYAQATGSGGVAIATGYSTSGPEAKTNAIAIGDKIISTGNGQYAYGIANFAANGDGQGSTYILLASTTDATATSMTTTGSSPNYLNQVGSNWQVNDTCLTFSGTIVAMQNGCQAYGSWEVKGLLVNDGGTVSVPSSAITVIHNASNWGISIGTDTTGGNNTLKIQVTGEASHNIRWVANIQTSQVTFA